MTEVEASLNARLRPLRVSEYEALARLGAFANERVELLRGRVVRMAPQGEEHSWVVGALNNLLVKYFGEWAQVRPATSMRAAEDSMPEPDFMLVPDTRAPGPLPTRALLLVEVAVSSLRDDRLVKAPLYAETGSPEYWIVNVEEAQLEVYRSPRDGQYQEHFVLGPGDTIRPVSFPGVEFPLRSFLVSAKH
jgi:Uma2 family endonuclease